MASIFLLPDELLAGVIQYLDLEYICQVPGRRSAARPNHVSLGLTCRRFSNLVRSSIFRYLYFERLDRERTPAADQRIGLGPMRFFDRLGVLMRLWSDNPETINCVKTVSYRSSFVYNNAFVNFMTLLGRSTSLEQLTLLSCQMTDLQGFARVLESYSHPFNHMKSIFIESTCGRLCPANLIFELIALPCLQNISLCVQVPGGDHLVDYLDYNSETSHVLPALVELSFTHRDFRGKILELIFARRQVRRLRLPHAGIHWGFFKSWDDQSRREIADEWDMSNLYAPVTLKPALAPAMAFLEELEIHCDYLWFHAHDGSVLDFSGFAVLKILKISDSLVLPPDRPHNRLQARDATLMKLLPPSLEALCVMFDNVRGLFWSTEELEAFPSNDEVALQDRFWIKGAGNEHIVKSSLSWVIEILNNREESFPTLHTLSVTECHERKIMSEFWKSFDIAPLYAHIFEKPHPTVSINIYVPKFWQIDLLAHEIA